MDKMQHNNITQPTRSNAPKYLVIALMPCLLLIGVYIGYSYTKSVPTQMISEQVSRSESTQGIQDATPAVSTTTLPSTPDAYLASPYRVVRVIPNPYYSKQSKYDSLVIVSQRGVNDDNCGGGYNASQCYFFLESTYYGIKTPVFAGTWSGGFPSLILETVKFISPTTISFDAHGGDAGYRVSEKWQFDLTTASSTLISQKIINEEPR